MTNIEDIQKRLDERIGFKLSTNKKVMSGNFGENTYVVDMATLDVFRLEGMERIDDTDDPNIQRLKALINEGCPAPENNPSATSGDDEDVSTEENVAEAEIVSDLPAMPTRSVATPTEYTDEQIQTISNTVAKGADQNELAMFLHLCTTYGLDPFLKEIFYSSQMKTIMTSRDGYLKIAQRDPAFGGMQSMAVCANDEFELDVINHTVKHKFGQGNRGDVIGAWAIVYRKGRNPVIAYADYAEYNKNNAIWKTYKSAMICKVAESFALKRQFGISGLVTREEIQEVA
jgi:phage recombination protein Bet